MATLQIGQHLVIEVEEDANSFEEQRGAAVLQPKRGAAKRGAVWEQAPPRSRQQGASTPPPLRSFGADFLEVVILLWIVETVNLSTCSAVSQRLRFGINFLKSPCGLHACNLFYELFLWEFC